MNDSSPSVLSSDSVRKRIGSLEDVAVTMARSAIGVRENLGVLATRNVDKKCWVERKRWFD
jgi:hypothetical protein